MKLERLFEVKGSQLYKISGEKFAITEENIRTVRWSDVEGEAEVYNEEYLAQLRDELKALEEKNHFVIIEPVFDKNCPAEQFTAAMKHTARRIKDCVSVIGFALPSEIEAEKDFYIEELSAKHAQYCFFSKNLQLESIARY